MSQDIRAGSVDIGKKGSHAKSASSREIIQQRGSQDRWQLSRPPLPDSKGSFVSARRSSGHQNPSSPQAVDFLNRYGKRSTQQTTVLVADTGSTLADEITHSEEPIVFQQNLTSAENTTANEEVLVGESVSLYEPPPESQLALGDRSVSARERSPASTPLPVSASSSSSSIETQPTTTTTIVDAPDDRSAPARERSPASIPLPVSASSSSSSIGTQVTTTIADDWVEARSFPEPVPVVRVDNVGVPDHESIYSGVSGFSPAPSFPQPPPPTPLEVKEDPIFKGPLFVGLASEAATPGSTSSRSEASTTSTVNTSDVANRPPGPPVTDSLIRDAVKMVAGDAIEEAASQKVNEIVRQAVEETTNNGIGNTIKITSQEAAPNRGDDIMQETMEEDDDVVNKPVEKATQTRIDEIMQDAAEKAADVVQHSVEEVARPRVDHNMQEAVIKIAENVTNDNVTNTAKEAIEDSIDGSMQENADKVDDVVNDPVEKAVQNSVDEIMQGAIGKTDDVVYRPVEEVVRQKIEDIVQEPGKETTANDFVNNAAEETARQKAGEIAREVVEKTAIVPVATSLPLNMPSLPSSVSVPPVSSTIGPESVLPNKHGKRRKLLNRARRIILRKRLLALFLGRRLGATTYATLNSGGQALKIENAVPVSNLDGASSWSQIPPPSFLLKEEIASPLFLPEETRCVSHPFQDDHVPVLGQPAIIDSPRIVAQPISGPPPLKRSFDSGFRYSGHQNSPKASDSKSLLKSERMQKASSSRDMGFFARLKGMGSQRRRDKLARRKMEEGGQAQVEAVSLRTRSNTSIEDDDSSRQRSDALVALPIAHVQASALSDMQLDHQKQQERFQRVTAARTKPGQRDFASLLSILELAKIKDEDPPLCTTCNKYLPSGALDRAIYRLVIRHFPGVVIGSEAKRKGWPGPLAMQERIHRDLTCRCGESGRRRLHKRITRRLGS